MPKLKELFEPIKIGKKTVKNRMALPPMILGEATPDGYVTQNMINRYRTLAEGGVGMMVVEGVALNSPCAKGIGGLIAQNNNIQGIANIADELRLRGVVSVMQLIHCGRQALPEANGGVQPVSVSEIPYWMGHAYSPTPHAASIEELEGIKQAYVEAALLAQAAGFDGAEVHNAHGYLLATFLSAKANNRTDKYGGSFENRMRYPLEVVRAIRAAVRPDFIVGVRISANYIIEGEPTVEDMRIFAEALDKEGIDYLSVSGGTYESHWKQSPPCYMPRNINISESKSIKESVSVPVLVAGGICYPEEANEIIKTGKADMVCLGRALFADPELPNKIKADRLDEIRPCIRCNLEFADSFAQHQVRCSVNFAMGREKEYEILPAAVKKKVMIVGGGPGGMEAARVAALRGHSVELYERSPSLGGSLKMASAPEHKEEIERLRKYFVRQMELRGVKVHTGTAVDEELIKKQAPDALVLALGAHPSHPPIKGIDSEGVLVGEDVLLHRCDTGKSVIVAGGGCVGIDLVLQLTGEGKHVTLVEMADICGVDLDIISWSAVNVRFNELIEKGLLEVHTSSLIKEIYPDGALIADEKGSESRINAENVVIALGYTSNTSDVERLSSIVPETYMVGDAVRARRIRQAVHEGFVAGYSI